MAVGFHLLRGLGFTRRRLSVSPACCGNLSTACPLSSPPILPRSVSFSGLSGCIRRYKERGNVITSEPPVPCQHGSASGEECPSRTAPATDYTAGCEKKRRRKRTGKPDTWRSQRLQRETISRRPLTPLKASFGGSAAEVMRARTAPCWRNTNTDTFLGGGSCFNKILKQITNSVCKYRHFFLY